MVETVHDNDSMVEIVHGHAPRVRKKKNSESGADSQQKEIVINTELLINKVADAAISAGVAYIVSKNT